MVVAQTVINSLAELWPVIARWVQAHGDRPLTPQELIALIRHCFPAWNQEEALRAYGRLQRNELVVTLAKSHQLELNRHLLDYARQLLQEQTLGLADEVLVLVTDLGRLQLRLEQAVAHGDGDDLGRQAALIDDRLRRIIKHLVENELAIHALAERVRAAGDGQSLASRYAEVLDAFDRYIEPMLGLLDLQGAARTGFAQLEQSLGLLLVEIGITGRLHRQRERLIHLLTRLLELERLARESVRRCADALLPLRDQLRRSTLVSQAAARVLARLRRGHWQQLDAQLPVLSADISSQRMPPHHQLLAFLGGVVKLPSHQAPALADGDFSRPRPANVPELAQVITRLQSAAAQGQPLLQALLGHYPQLDTDELLYLHQQLHQQPQFQLARQPARSQHTTASHSISLFDAQLALAATASVAEKP